MGLLPRRMLNEQAIASHSREIASLFRRRSKEVACVKAIPGALPYHVNARAGERVDFA